MVDLEEEIFLFDSHLVERICVIRGVVGGLMIFYAHVDVYWQICQVAWTRHCVCGFRAKLKENVC